MNIHRQKINVFADKRIVPNNEIPICSFVTRLSITRHRFLIMNNRTLTLS